MGFLTDVITLLYSCWRKVVQETWKWGRQIVLVCMHWSSCLINASDSICLWIHPSEYSLKYWHSYLAHTLGLLLLFACFLKKVHGYLSAKHDNSSLDPRKIGVFTKTSWSCCSILLTGKRGRSPEPQHSAFVQERYHCIPEEGIIYCRRICSLS